MATLKPTVSSDLTGGADETDVRLIVQTVAALEQAQRQRSPAAFIRLFTASAVWVTAFGRRFKGREEIATFTRQVLTPDLGDTYGQYQVVHVAFLRPDVATVTVHQRTANGAGLPLAGEADGSSLYVMVKEQGQWLIAAGQNTKINDAALAAQNQKLEAR